MNIRKTFALTAFLIFIGVPMLALAKKPHPLQPDPAPAVDSCSCDEFLLNEATDPDQWESLCTVQWTTFDGSWPAYGADIEFEAEWFDVSDMSAGSETELEDYSCESGDFDAEADADDQRCAATDVAVVIPLHSNSGSTDFEAKVKGFDNAAHPGSRDFAKARGDCSPLPVL